MLLRLIYRNGVRKTTVPEAVRVCAVRGCHETFEELIRKNHEYVTGH